MDRSYGHIAVTLSFGCARKGLPAAASFRRWVEAALRIADREAGEVSIRIIDEDEGRALNRDYRGKDYPTNVLSFPADLPAGFGSELLGDLAFCAPVVAREAVEQGKPVQAHYAHLTVHGVLHLLGWDHEEAVAAEEMEALEVAALARLGIADPYL